MNKLEKAPGLNTVEAISDSIRDLFGSVIDFGKETGGKAVNSVISWVGNSVSRILGGVVNDLFALPIFPIKKGK